MKKVLLSAFWGVLIAGGLLTARAQNADQLPLDSFVVPESLGKIEERFVGTSSRMVIYIQNVHAHLTAQENIAAIIDHLNYVYDINKVGVEGGWSASSWPKTWSLPSSQGKQNFAHLLMEEDYIGGPAYAAMFSKTPILLVGLEDRDVYEKNRAAYLKSLDRQKDVEAKIKSREDKLTADKKAAFGTDLWNFDVTVTQFREGKNAEKMIPAILTWADERKVDISDLDQIALFQQISDLAKSIQKPKLESEAKRLMKEYKRAGLTFEELLMSGKIPEEKLSHYPESVKLVKLMKLQGTLSHRKFFAELEEAIRRIKAGLFKSDEEKQADSAYARFQTAKQIIILKATPSDLTTFESFKADIGPEISAAGLQEALEIALEFYQTAKARDDIFFRKITGDDRLSGNIVIVTGGFHTEGLAGKLEQAGISYMVITPELGKESPNDELYSKRLRENIVVGQNTAEAPQPKARTEIDESAARITIRQRKSAPPPPSKPVLPEKNEIAAQADPAKQSLSEDQDQQTSKFRDSLFPKALAEGERAKNWRAGIPIYTGQAVEKPAKRTVSTRKKAGTSPGPAIRGDFAAAPDADQRKVVEFVLNNQAGRAPVAAVFRASGLNNLMTPQSDAPEDIQSARLTRTNFLALLDHDANKIYLINDDETAFQNILGLVPETNRNKRNIKPLPADQVLSQSLAKVRQKYQRIALVDQVDPKSFEDILVIPPSPIAAILIRPLLDYAGLGNMLLNSEAMKAFAKVLTDILNEQNLWKSA
jgi:hypothetical protein